MATDTQSIRAEPHAEIGSLLERDAALLVDRWCRRALAEQPGAKSVHVDELRDQLPNFLRAMGRALRQAGNPDAGQHTRAAFEHGDQRWDAGWSLTAVVRDYQLLKVVVLEHLESALARPLLYREAMAVGVFLDDAIAASIVSYVASRDDHHRRAEEQRTQELRAASRHKDEFLALLAHELRNPLAPIANGIRVMHLLLGSPAGQLRRPGDAGLGRGHNRVDVVARRVRGRVVADHDDAEVLQVRPERPERLPDGELDVAAEQRGDGLRAALGRQHLDREAVLGEDPGLHAAPECGRFGDR